MDLERKLGPLPVWAWAGVGTTGLAGLLILHRRKAAAAAAASASAGSVGGSDLGTVNAASGVPTSTPIAPGQSSYYYVSSPGAGTTPAGTQTQSQALAQAAAANLAAQQNAMLSAEHQLGLVNSAQAAHPSATLTSQASILQTAITAAQAAIQHDVQELLNPGQYVPTASGA